MNYYEPEAGAGMKLSLRRTLQLQKVLYHFHKKLYAYGNEVLPEFLEETERFHSRDETKKAPKKTSGLQ